MIDQTHLVGLSQHLNAIIVARIQQALGLDPAGTPSGDEADAFALTVALVAAGLLAYLAVSLPEEARNNIRAFVDRFVDDAIKAAPAVQQALSENVAEGACAPRPGVIVLPESVNHTNPSSQE